MLKKKNTLIKTKPDRRIFSEKKRTRKTRACIQTKTEQDRTLFSRVDRRQVYKVQTLLDSQVFPGKYRYQTGACLQNKTGQDRSIFSNEDTCAGTGKTRVRTQVKTDQDRRVFSGKNRSKKGQVCFLRQRLTPNKCTYPRKDSIRQVCLPDKDRCKSSLRSSKGAYKTGLSSQEKMGKN